MIQLLTGDNTFEIDRALSRLRAKFSGEVACYEADDLTPEQLPDVLMSQTLFAADRLVIIKRPAGNKTLWSTLPDVLAKFAGQTQLIIVEPSPDRRTSTYKWLQKHATVQMFAAWKEYDTAKAEQWVIDEARRRSVALKTIPARALVARVGVDQWHLSAAVDKLALVDTITTDTIEQIIDARPQDSALTLLETALAGDTAATQVLLANLRVVDDPYRVMGLLASQALQLALLAGTNAPPSTVAADSGASPYVLGKLQPFARQLSRQGAKRLLQALAAADRRMKSSDVDPWLHIEQALQHIKTAS